MTQCSARSKQSGQQCRRAVAPGKTVCRSHGGKSLAGIASPTLATGRYSKYLPARLAGRYEEALRDRDLLSLRDEIALTEARIGELLSEMEARGSADGWPEVQALMDQRRRLSEAEVKRLVAARQTITVEEAQTLIMALLASVRKHVTDRATLAAIQSDVTRLTHHAAP